MATTTTTSDNKPARVPKHLRELQDFNKGPVKSDDDDASTRPTSPSSGEVLVAMETVTSSPNAVELIPAELLQSERRSRRRSSAAAAVACKPVPKKAKTESSASSSAKKKQPSSKEQDHLDMTWICAACREAECAMEPNSELLVCEGSCKRLFHTNCAGMAEVPPEEVAWQCHDCTNGKHLCGFCQEYGVDGEDVFKCQRAECGWFFHEACLEMHNVFIERPPQPQQQDDAPSTPGESTPTKDAASTQPKTLKFACPAHSCWTCTQADMAETEDKQKQSKTGKGRGKGKRSSGLFSCKRDSRLFPCLECPMSFHLTCIPPMSKFHELALLCHNCAQKAELPTLDMEASYQGSVEARCDEKLEKLRNWDNVLAKRAKKNGRYLQRVKKSKNPFFPRGVASDKKTTRENFVLDKLQTHAQPLPVAEDASRDEMFLCRTVPNDRLMFSLPADVQEEVHSKPPLYKHIHALKYYPDKKPKRIPLSKDVCNCTTTCDDACLNRLLYVECYGNQKLNDGKELSKQKATNCRLGPNCGNRQLGQRQHVKKCQPKREKGKGWGLVTLEHVPKGNLVQEYMGDVIDEAEKERRLHTWNLEHPNDPNYYIMCLSQGWYVDARETANLARFINHSCDPNCILLRQNVGGFMRDGIYALRSLQPGEFLSYDYHFDTKQGDKFICRCGSKNCRGTMKERKLEKEASNKKTKTQLWNEAKAQYEKDEKYLAELEEHQKELATIGPMLPGTGKASEVDEWVSNGVSKDRAAAVRNRIFLWRNAVKGSDFERRFGRYNLENQKGDEGNIRRRIGKTKKTNSDKPKPKATIDVLAVVAAGGGDAKGAGK